MVLLWHCSNCYLTLQNHVSVENITTLLMKTQWKEFPALFPCTLKHHLIKKSLTLARCHYNIGRNVVLIETMCSDLDLVRLREKTKCIDEYLILFILSENPSLNKYTLNDMPGHFQ